MYTKEETAANRAKWVAALRSGEYEQITGQLGSSAGYCCLGVACEVAMINGLDIGKTIHYDGAEFQYDEAHNVLPFSVVSWLGLWSTHTGGRLSEPVAGDIDTLWELNDVLEYTFEQIADVIESGNVRLAE